MDMTSPLLKLTHEQAVEELNRTFAQLLSARAQCHAEILRVLERPRTEQTSDYVLSVVDTYAETLEAHCGKLAELNLMKPGAWHASEPGRRQRANIEALNRLVTDAFDALLHGPVDIA